MRARRQAVLFDINPPPTRPAQSAPARFSSIRRDGGGRDVIAFVLLEAVDDHRTRSSRPDRRSRATRCATQRQNPAPARTRRRTDPQSCSTACECRDTPASARVLRDFISANASSSRTSGMMAKLYDGRRRARCPFQRVTVPRIARHIAVFRQVAVAHADDQLQHLASDADRDQHRTDRSDRSARDANAGLS